MAGSALRQSPPMPLCDAWCHSGRNRICPTLARPFQLPMHHPVKGRVRPVAQHSAATAGKPAFLENAASTEYGPSRATQIITTQRVRRRNRSSTLKGADASVLRTGNWPAPRLRSSTPFWNCKAADAPSFRKNALAPQFWCPSRRVWIPKPSTLVVPRSGAAATTGRLVLLGKNHQRRQAPPC